MENTKAIENICEVLDDEIKQIAKKGDNISPQELDNAYKAMKTIYYGEAVKAMSKAESEREQGMNGYSQNRGYSYNSMRAPYFHTYDQSMDNYSRDGSYADGRSYANGRSYDGSYDMSRDGGQIVLVPDVMATVTVFIVKDLMITVIGEVVMLWVVSQAAMVGTADTKTRNSLGSSFNRCSRN